MNNPTPSAPQRALKPHQIQEILQLTVNSPADVSHCIRRIISLTQDAQDRIGYFAALYIHVATAFEAALADGTFSHPDYMAHLDVVFFRRYLLALKKYLTNASPSLCWQIAFDATPDPHPIVLQHLLLGMNAHINFDLGIATFDAAKGQDLTPLRDDFNKMNSLLASLLTTVMDDLSQIWPWLTIIDRAFGPIDDTLINFAMRQARDHAWSIATTLAASSDSTQQRRTIDQLQTRTSALADLLWNPGCLINLPIAIIRAGERGNPRQIIKILSDQSPQNIAEYQMIRFLHKNDPQ